MTMRLRVTFLACLVSILVAAPRLGAQGTTYNFAHIADGLSSPGNAWITQFQFTNSGVGTGAVSCTLVLYDDLGNALTVTTVGNGTNHIFTFTIQEGNEFFMQTTGAGGAGGILQTGRAILFCDKPISSGASYTYYDPGQPITTVGVLPSYPADTFVSPANYLTGIALDNLDPANPLSANIVANNSDGTPAGTATQTLPPLNHTSFNLNAAIPSLPSTFTGSLTITANQPTMLALGIGVQTNTTGFVVSAIPAISYVALGPNFSGTYNIISGPDAGTSGNITISGVGAFDTGKFGATVNIAFKTSGAGGPVEIDQGSFDRGTMIDGCKIPLPGPPWPSGIIAAGQVQPDGSISGAITGCKPTDTDVATFQLTPSS